MTGPTPRSGRGRRPAGDVRRDALAAASSVLLADGVGAVTFERVAQQGGVSRTTLRKWWSSPAALAVEAFFVDSDDRLGLPDSGDLARDIRTQLDGFVHLMTATPAGRAVRGLIAAAQHDDEVRRAFVDHYVRPRREVGGSALSRAQRRGQLDAGVDVQVLVDQVWGACYYRLLTEPERVTPDYLDTLVAQAPGLTGRARPPSRADRD